MAQEGIGDATAYNPGLMATTRIFYSRAYLLLSCVSAPGTNPAPGVMPTKPQTAPVAAPMVEGFPPDHSSKTIQLQ